jgi:O-antigen/teichoic acid export membrane protein
MITYYKSKLYSLLKSSEKYTKTDMIYLARGGFWLTLANLLTSTMVLVMAVVFANQIPAHAYGVYKYFLSILGILSIFTLTGIGGMVSQAVARGMEGSVIIGLKTKIRWGILGACASVGMAIYYYTQQNYELSIIFLIAMLFVPFMDSFHIYQDYLQGKKFFNISSRYIAISQFIATGLMIATVFITSNIFIILLVYLASWTFVRIFFFVKTIKKYPPNTLIDQTTLPMGMHASFIDVIATLIGSLDAILIFHYLGSVELAVYSFAIAPVTQMVSLFRNIPTLAMPKMATRSIKEIAALLYKRIGLIFFLSIFVTVTYIIFAPLIFQIFFSQYISSIYFSRVYALTILISIPLTMLSPAINAKINYIPKKMLYLWNIPGALSTLFIFFFIQKIGLMSVIYARILLLVVNAGISTIFWIYIIRKDKKITSAQHIGPL